MATEAQITANKANAQHSQGPTSEAGKSRSSLNAITTGLTARTVLLSSEDAAIYKAHLDRYFAKYDPANDDEHDLVQFIADTNWRLLRIAPLEASIYAIGRDACEHSVAHEKDPKKREGALLGHIYLTYKKDLNNLALQERRLSNQLEKAVAELKAMQKERTGDRLNEICHAKRSLEAFERSNLEPNFAEFGFDFSVAEFQAYQIRQHAYSTLAGGKELNFDKFLKEFRSKIAVAA